VTVIIDATGLREYSRYLKMLPDIAPRAAALAINQTAERQGLTLAREAMLSEVAFPVGYLNGSDGVGQKRFRLKYRAGVDRLEAGIVGQFTPTPLARFSSARTGFARARVSGRRRRRSAAGTGVTVTIQPGRPRAIKRAFLINLRSGNVGLGIRLRPGETMEHTVGAKLITSGPLAGVALLYGPSVDQVFRTVAVDISPALLVYLQAEFLRQIQRMSGGRGGI
jgi:hypothetical protein